MPLTLRPTGLSRDPNAQDWCIYDGGTEPVGRVYEDRTAPTEASRWAWFLQVTDAHEAGVETSGRAATLDEAKAAFKENHDGYQQWRDTGMRHHRPFEAVSAEIINWQGRVGVTFIYSDGQRDSREIRPSDWAIIRRLKAAGHLAYQDDEVRAGMDEIAKRGLDR